MKKVLSVIILCCLGIIIYSNTFQSSFQFDDGPYIVKNLNIRNLANLSAIWHNWPTRLVIFFTFALNYHFHKFDIFGYHLTNIVIHIGSAILVRWLIFLTLSTPIVKKYRISQHSNLIALFGALIFLCHPIQTESVTYIYQRCASLTGFLYLLSLTIYVKSRLSEISGRSIHKIRFLYILSLSFGVIVMLAKEHAFTLPLMVFLYEFCFLKVGNRLRWKRTLPFLFILPIIPILLFATKPATFIDIERLSERPVAGGYYLLTQFRVMVTYLRLLFIPLNQNLDYAYPISKSLLELPTLASLFLLIIIIVIAIRIFSRYRLISFGIFWFFLTLLPESSVVPLGDLIFEHRLYLPSLGFSFFLVSGVYYLVGKKSLQSMTAILLIIVTFYSILTYNRNFVWKDPFSLWNDVVHKSPGKARPYNNRGDIYNKKGDYDLALLDFNQAIELDPNSVEAYKAYNNRGATYVNIGDFNLAILDLDRAIKLNPNYALAYNNRGLVYGKKGNYDLAILDFSQAIELRPDYAEAYNNRGAAYYNKGNYNLALLDFNQAIKLSPNYAETYNNRGVAYLNKGNYDLALLDFNQAIKLDPDSVEAYKAYNNRGVVYGNKGNYDLAILDFSQAIELRPDYVEAYNNRGVVYGNKGNYDLAILDFNQAIKLSPNYAETYNNRGFAYLKKGNYDLALLDFNQAIELDPDYAKAFRNRAVVYYFKREYEKAWEDVHKTEALEKVIDPDFLEALKKASGRER